MKIAKTLPLILITTGIIVLAMFLHNPKHFPLKSVAVNASYQHLSQNDLRKIITPFLKNVSFFSINLSGIKTQLLQLPWVYQIDSHRVWPDKIVITITEQQPVAVWNNNSLINPDGQIFTLAKESIPNDLPALAGPDDESEQVWQFFEDTNKILQPFELHINSLSFDPGIGWQLTLSDNIAVQFGSEDLAIKMQQFIKSIPKVIKPRETEIQSIDFRYTNGFAVQYRQTSPTAIDALPPVQPQSATH